MKKKNIEVTEEVEPILVVAEEIVKEASVVNGAEEVKRTEEIIYFKATRGLTIEEHEALSEKLTFEKKNTGLKIILIPFLLDIADGEVIE